MNLSNICDALILISAAAMAVANIIALLRKTGKAFGATHKRQIVDVIEEVVPDMLAAHDLETRKKYLADRQKYLQDITEEVTNSLTEQLSAIQTHEERMQLFSEALKELLRERIMLIYGRNRMRRRLEEHEKIELEHCYVTYKALGGNSYIDGYYERMLLWEVVPDEEQ